MLWIPIDEISQDLYDGLWKEVYFLQSQRPSVSNKRNWDLP